MVNKTRLIEEHLKSAGSITPSTAWRSYGVMRLADVIYRLKKRGMEIDTETEVANDKFGNKVRYARYRLVG